MRVLTGLLLRQERVLPIEAFGEFSHSAPEPPPVKIYEEGRLQRPEEMPMQQAAWYGKETRSCILEFASGTTFYVKFKTKYGKS